MLRFTLGFGPSGARTGAGADRAKLGGTAAYFSIDLGGAVSNHVVVHGRLSRFGMSDPSLTEGDRDLGEISGSTFSMSILGIGVTYYFMPINLYLTGALGMSTAQADGRLEISGDLGSGPGAEFDVGKEWWVGDEWGLGVALRASLLSVPQTTALGSSNDWLGWGMGLLFSVTYN